MFVFVLANDLCFACVCIMLVMFVTLHYTTVTVCASACQVVCMLCLSVVEILLSNEKRSLCVRVSFFIFFSMCLCHSCPEIVFMMY